MLKLALIGDLHLSERSPRHAHTLEVLEAALSDFAGVTADATPETTCAIVFLGDIFEGAPSPREYHDLVRILHNEAGVMDQDDKIALVLGNHEHSAALCWLPLLNVWRIDVADDHFGVLDFREARVLLVPYPRRGRPPFDRLEDDGTIAGSMSAAAQKIAEEIAIQRRTFTDRPVIVLGHFTIEGMATRDAEFELHTATECVVPRSAFDGVALAAVGHVHKAQDVAPHIIGVGSLIRQSFAEADDAKSYTLVTVDAGHVTWERRPVSAREMVVWSWTMDAETQIDVEAYAREAAGREVKLIVSIPENQLGAVDVSIFDPIKEAAAFFVLERVTLTAERTRAPEIARADTLDAQLGAWLAATEAEVDEAARERLGVKVAEVQG